MECVQNIKFLKIQENSRNATIQALKDIIDQKAVTVRKLERAERRYLEEVAEELLAALKDEASQNDVPELVARVHEMMISDHRLESGPDDKIPPVADQVTTDVEIVEVNDENGGKSAINLNDDPDILQLGRDIQCLELWLENTPETNGVLQLEGDDLKKLLAIITQHQLLDTVPESLSARDLQHFIDSLNQRC